MLRLLACSSFLFLTATLPVRAADSQADRLARFLAARDETNLVTSTGKPWHMAVTFSLMDYDGKEKEQGTLEEWWSSPTHWRQAFTSPSFTYDRVRDDTRNFVSAQAMMPYLLSTMLHDLVAPLPHFGHDNPILKQESRIFDAHHFDCFTVDFSPGGKSLNPSVLPLYCFDHETYQLRFIRTYNIETVLLNRPGRFLDKTVNLDLTILEDRKPALHATVTTLESMSPDDAHLTAVAKLQPLNNTGLPTTLPFPPKRLKGPDPNLPIGIPRNEAGGTVLLSVEIDANGQIASLEPIFATEAVLETAAIEAVKRWTFQPYTVDGKPTRVVTHLRINFPGTH